MRGQSGQSSFPRPLSGAWTSTRWDLHRCPSIYVAPDVDHALHTWAAYGGEITMDRSRLLVGGSIKHSGLLRPTRFCDRSEPDTSRHGNARPRPSEKVPSREAEGGNNG